MPSMYQVLEGLPSGALEPLGQPRPSPKQGWAELGGQEPGGQEPGGDTGTWRVRNAPASPAASVGEQGSRRWEGGRGSVGLSLILLRPPAGKPDGRKEAAFPGASCAKGWVDKGLRAPPQPSTLSQGPTQPQPSQPTQSNSSQCWGLPPQS